MCYIYKDNQKSAYIQNIYWVYADYIRQLSYERTFSVPSSLAVVFFHSVSFLFPFSNQIFTLFLVQFVDSLLVLFQMLAQHGIHISAY